MDQSAPSHIKEVDLAWAAGFFDGEGHVGYSSVKPASSLHTRRRQRRIYVRMTQTDPDLVRRFRKIVGVGRIHGPYNRDPSHRPVYQYEVYGVPSVTRIFDLLSPYLSPRKVEQFQKAFSDYNAHPLVKPQG